MSGSSPITTTLLVHAPGPAPEHAPPSPSSDGEDITITRDHSNDSNTETLRPSVVKATAAAAAASFKTASAARPLLPNVTQDVLAADAAAGSEKVSRVRVELDFQPEEGEEDTAPTATPGVDDGGGRTKAMTGKRSLLSRKIKARNVKEEEHQLVSVRAVVPSRGMVICYLSIFKTTICTN